MQLSDKNIDVLIVGAGPAGLMMACQLALRKISFRIIDKRDQPASYSGALIVQARTLEIFQQMGIAQLAIREGIIASELKLIFNGKKSFVIPVKGVGKDLTAFPFLLMLEQSKTEQLLIDFLQNQGSVVECETELLRFTQGIDGVVSRLIRPDGVEEAINSKYLIAADGARSTIRKQLQIPFVGEIYPITLFVTDCKAEVDLPPNMVCFSFSDKATAGFSHYLKGDGVLIVQFPENLN
jgi:2-polyprenyl-6-methoxyphenol hydroxylase-like FAD-dependent oxidoreductase